ncbi:MAG: TonB-dependent receptor [Usitatibacter sp.]
MPDARADNPAEVMELGKIDVVATTPLPGLGTPLADVPANVQIFSARDIAGRRTATLPEFLSGAASTALNSAQGNPFQPDFSFRGFTASPLLGLAQGLSVFQDGVRVNESFGDVVNWDLIPKAAIASAQLLPGSNPAFGPNTLGGAISLHTKSGSQFPGGSLDAQGGSFGRRALEVEQGGSRGPWDYYVTATGLRDDGWAQHNPSRVQRLFAKGGYQTDVTDVDVTLTAADNTLEGTQTLPRSFLDDIRQAYTFPDRTTNRLAFLTVKASHFFSQDALVGATLYARHLRTANLASNVNGDFGGDADAPEATNDESSVEQKSYGAGVQLTFDASLAGRASRFVAGASADFGDARFVRRTQPAAFDASRGTVATGDFALATDARSRDAHYGVFVHETLTLNDAWIVTASTRWSEARIRIEDLGGGDPGLAGSHRFSRASPALAFTFKPARELTAYASYAQSMRAPTPIELTCADPGAPCKLPNNFLSDPPLKLVAARTVEIGARGSWADGGTWSAALYRTDLGDDIQFVASGSGATNAGFFRNVGGTRREGVELIATHSAGAFAFDARASFIAATFRSRFTESSPNNSSADASGAIEVEPGRRIPGIPSRSLKVRARFAPGETWSIAVSYAAYGAVYARGDENNRDAGGTIAGFAVADLDARWRFARDTEAYVSVSNLFDRRYTNFGVLGRNFFANPARVFDGDHPVSETFVAPGAPRGIWIGLRHEWR